MTTPWRPVRRHLFHPPQPVHSRSAANPGDQPTRLWEAFGTRLPSSVAQHRIVLPFCAHASVFRGPTTADLDFFSTYSACGGVWPRPDGGKRARL